MASVPTQSRVTVTTSPTLLASSTGTISVAFIIRNLDATNSVYVGNSAVTTADGFEVKAGEVMSGTLGAAAPDIQPLYAISAGSVSVAVLTRVSAP